MDITNVRNTSSKLYRKFNIYQENEGFILPSINRYKYIYKKKGFLKETSSHKSKNVSSLKNSTLHDHVVHTEQNENVGCPIAGVEIYS